MAQMDMKACFEKMMGALKGKEDGAAILALKDLTYDMACGRSLRLTPGERAAMAIELALLAKRSGAVINLEEEVQTPVVVSSRPIYAPAPVELAINEVEVDLDVELALAELDKAIAKDGGYVGDIDPFQAPEEDEVFALSAEGSLIDQLFLAIEKPVISDEQLALVIEAAQPKGKQFDITTAELDLSGNYELTDAPEETIVPERGFGMDFGFVSLGE